MKQALHLQSHTVSVTSIINVCKYTYRGKIIIDHLYVYTTGIQKLLCSPYCILFSCLVLCLLFACSAMSYIPYKVYLRGSDSTHTYYALTNAAIQCGTGNSQKYEGIYLSGLRQRGDTLEGAVKAWLVRKHDLKLYNETVGPFYSGYTPLPGHHYVQLLGSSVYLWEGSLISGYCCVHNQKSTEQTASLFVFTTFEDSVQFQGSNPPKNYILTEKVNIPQADSHCFTKWGKNSPLRVKESSYYFFVVEFSADNMNFTAKIIYDQNSVNTSDYSYPHKFQYNTWTYLMFPTGVSNPTEYVTICRAPDYLAVNETTHPEAESIHIESWGALYWWRHAFLAILILSLCGVVVYGIASFSILLWLRNLCILQACVRRCLPNRQDYVELPQYNPLTVNH